MCTLRVEIRETPEAVIIRLEGEAGVTAVDALQAPFNAVVARQPALVVFDLSGLRFGASLFLGALIGLRRGVVRRGGRVKLAAPSEAIRDVVTASRLDQLFEIVETVPEAIGTPALVS